MYAVHQQSRIHNRADSFEQWISQLEVFENQARPEKEYQALDHSHDAPMNQTSMFANHGEIGERSDLERYDYQSFEHTYGGITDHCQIRSSQHTITEQIRGADVTQTVAGQSREKEKQADSGIPTPWPGQGRSRIITSCPRPARTK